MKKKISLILTLALVLSLFIPTTAFAATAAKEKESNNNAATATAFTGAVQGKLSTVDDVDYFKVNAKDDYYTFNFTVNAAYKGVDAINLGWHVTIFDNNMNKLFEQNTGSVFTTPRFCIPGTIYIKVEAKSAYVGNAPVNVPYDLTYTGKTNAKWENEHNDLSTSANSIAVNTTYFGSLHNAEDQDWFVVNPQDYFSVSFSRNTSVPTDYDVNLGWKVSVYDKTSKELQSFNVSTSDTSIVFPISGPIYVKVEAKSAYTGNAPCHVYYNLKVNSAVNAAWENEYNDKSTTANTIKQGSTYHGNLHHAEDVDYFKVKSTTKAIAVKFNIKLSEVDRDAVGKGWKITVSTEDSARPIASYTIDTIGSTQSITLPYAKGEYYYVKVEADSIYDAPVGQTYHISVVDASDDKNWEVENGKTGVKSAAALNESKVIYGNLANEKDVDYFKINVISGGTIDVTFKREDADNDGKGYKVRVIDAAGKVIFTGKADDTTSKTFSKIKVAKGTYYIIVEAESVYDVPGADINYNLSYKLTLAKHKAKTTASKNTVKVSWSKKSDVYGYQIQYSTNKNFSGAKTVTIKKNSTTSTTINNTDANKVYYVRIRTIVKDGSKNRYSAWSDAVVAVNTPAVKKVTPSKGTLKVTWDKNVGATGYQIQYSTNKDFSGAKAVSISKNSVTSATIKNTSANKTYYVRIRTVVKGSTTYYSAWSAASAVKAK